MSGAADRRLAADLLRRAGGDHGLARRRALRMAEGADDAASDYEAVADADIRACAAQWRRVAALLDGPA